MIKVCISDTIVHKLGIDRRFYSKQRILKSDLSTNPIFFCSITIELKSTDKFNARQNVRRKIRLRWFKIFDDKRINLHLDERMVTAKHET